MDPITYDPEKLRNRIAAEPFKSALLKVWCATDLEGFLAHYVANDAFAKDIAHNQDAFVNTDDRNIIEFSFARTVGTKGSFGIPIAREAAHRRSQDRPSHVNGAIDWTRVDDQNAAIYTHIARTPAPTYYFLTADQRYSALAQTAYATGNSSGAMELWRQQHREPSSLTEWTMIAEIFAASGDSNALPYIKKVSELSPAEGAMLLATLRARERRYIEATDALVSAYEFSRAEPWAMALIFNHSFDIAVEIASRDRGGPLALRLYRALEQPFSVKVSEAGRLRALYTVGRIIDNRGYTEYTRKAIAAFEPEVPWEHEFLQVRRDCYRALADPLATKAERDLAAFVENEPSQFILQN
jgi:spermidine synthase